RQSARRARLLQEYVSFHYSIELVKMTARTFAALYPYNCRNRRLVSSFRENIHGIFREHYQEYGVCTLAEAERLKATFKVL
ncbi:hypothetical protein, partial [Ralstonia pseudosolanacearum]|uniref:hypothetical protein n=1 Tax=Ralstonia pseudosolanacearum TaxID=1310165 RepID=UPI003CE7D78F